MHVTPYRCVASGVSDAELSAVVGGVSHFGQAKTVQPALARFPGGERGVVRTAVVTGACYNVQRIDIHMLRGVLMDEGQRVGAHVLTGGSSDRGSWLRYMRADA